MIAKKILSKSVKSKSSHMKDLTNYITNEQRKDVVEKVLFSGARGFLCNEFVGQQSEMLALMTECVKSANPLVHWVLSWRDGEHPTPVQIEEAIGIFLEELEMSSHQVIWAAHHQSNTHIHLAINKVHPLTLTVVRPNNGFDIESAHRAIARIEHKQGWGREVRGRYEVASDGRLARLNNDCEMARQPSQQNRDAEHRTGLKSRHRIAIEVASPLIVAATSWAHLHRSLARQGMRYIKKGSGALIYVDDAALKASSVHRMASLKKMEARLGPFQEFSGDLLPTPLRRVQCIRKGEGLWERYIQEREAFFERKARSAHGLILMQKAEHAELIKQHRLRRGRLFSGRWLQKLELLNAFRSVLAAEQAAEKAAIRDRHAAERSAVRLQHGYWPKYQQWLEQCGQGDQAQAWRCRLSAGAHIVGLSTTQPTVCDIRSFLSDVRADGMVHYFKKGNHSQNSTASFVDQGKRININDVGDEDSILAALQLASQKWEKFSVTGNATYIEKCVQLSARYGFKLSNSELESRVQAAREQLHLERITRKTYSR